MEAINHILVCLDLTEIDPSMIQYAAYVADLFDAGDVTFIHAIQAYDLPERRRKSFAEVRDSLAQKIREELDELIDESFRKSHSIRVVTRIEQEDAADGILEYIGENGIDLTLIGQKFGEERKGHYGKKIAENAPCHILFVTENPDADRLKKALCAIDFTEASETAFQVALYLAKHHRIETIAYFVQDRSNAYFPSSTLRSASRKQSLSEQSYHDMLDKYGVDEKDFPCRIETGDSMISEPEKLYNLAEEEDVGLIIVGAQGDTATETSLLGNISETLRRMQTDIPIMIVKDGGQESLLDIFRSGE